MRRMFRCTLWILLVFATADQLLAQQVSNTRRLYGCRSKTAIEFIAPMVGEEIPNFHGPSPNPESWHVVLEVALDQYVPKTPVKEGFYVPSPAQTAPQPTDVNGDGTLGDPHPAIPGLTLVIEDDLIYNGFVLPAGTNLASFFEMIGSEAEHGGKQSTTLTWILDPLYFLADLNGDMGTTLVATINNKTDTVFVRHGWDPMPQGMLSPQNPTITIWTADWISTIDSDIPAGQETHWVVGVEVRIPCFFDPVTSPPTPVPLDPVFGPCHANTMACTGNWGPQPGPGVHPAFPSLDVRFSDDYFDPVLGGIVQGGVISGGQCGIIWGSTGQSLAYAFRQSSVSAWYGVNGVPDTTPQGGGDDQMIYRFTMLVDGQVHDTDALPGEMLITAAVEATSNCFSITNLRVAHDPIVVTPDP